MIKNIILLDRNIISIIRQKLNGQKFVQPRIKIIRKLDRDYNFIGSIFSIQEGRKGFIENKQELALTVLEESKIIKKFFKNAKTDSEFIFNKKNTLTEALEDNTSIRWNTYYKFLFEVNDILYQKIAKNKQMKYKENIVNKALNLKIDLGSPIFQCTLSILFGSDISQKILKFKKS